MGISNDEAVGILGVSKRRAWNDLTTPPCIRLWQERWWRRRRSCRFGLRTRPQRARADQASKLITATIEQRIPPDAVKSDAKFAACSPNANDVKRRVPHRPL
ncbi:hypothetical protein OPV22_001895 [Ensete ventricosum]|uniref:Uncharacterized protein n=1 Tax=Ensete ventricosum TaxID=4639 RepID=A0AAV8QDN7_ENSVE|nr:hypothetical protein OPV22_001895 [Ensete ventricosum]